MRIRKKENYAHGNVKNYADLFLKEDECFIEML